MKFTNTLSCMHVRYSMGATISDYKRFHLVALFYYVFVQILLR